MGFLGIYLGLYIPTLLTPSEIIFSVFCVLFCRILILEDRSRCE